VFFAPLEVGEAQEEPQGEGEASGLPAGKGDVGDAGEQEQEDQGFEAFPVGSVPVQYGVHISFFTSFYWGSLARRKALSSPVFDEKERLRFVSQLG